MRMRLMPYKVNWTTVIIFLVVFAALCCVPAYCQSTTASATVVDGGGVTWANGTWKLDLIPNPSYPINNVQWNGSPLPPAQWHYSGNLDNSGNFSQSVPDNNFITPVGSSYTVTVCPNATAPCSVIQNISITGASLNLSSQITSATPALSVPPQALARAYNDAEVNVNASLVGYIYQNVTEGRPRYWNGSVWSDFNAGVETFTSGNLSPLFNTSNGGSPTAWQLQFSLLTAGPQTVFGNCTVATGNPVYCAITSAMLPNPASININGSATSLAGLISQCPSATPQTVATGIQNTGAANCYTVTFPDVSGNISTTQMNSGTGSSSSTVFAGGNSNHGQWVTVPSLFPSGFPTIIQHISIAGCTIATPSSYQTCSVSGTWPTAFANNTYQLSCFGINPQDSGNATPARAQLVGTTSTGKTTTGVTVIITSTGTSTGSVGFSGVDCIAME